MYLGMYWKSKISNLNQSVIRCENLGNLFVFYIFWFFLNSFHKFISCTFTHFYTLLSKLPDKNATKIHPKISRCRTALKKWFEVKKWEVESAYKPGSVGDNHSSRFHVTVKFKQPTLAQSGQTIGLYLVLLQTGFAMPL